MANQPVTREKLINADKDVQVIEDFIKKPKDETVTTRFGDQIMTLKGLEEEVKKSGGYFKRYTTLAAANADIANIPVNGVVKVTNAVDGGDYERATAGAASLTKSPYDSLAQAKADATTKANAAESNAKSYSEQQRKLGENATVQCWFNTPYYEVDSNSLYFKPSVGTADRTFYFVDRRYGNFQVTLTELMSQVDTIFPAEQIGVTSPRGVAGCIRFIVGDGLFFNPTTKIFKRTVNVTDRESIALITWNYTDVIRCVEESRIRQSIAEQRSKEATDDISKRLKEATDDISNYRNNYDVAVVVTNSGGGDAATIPVNLKSNNYAQIIYDTSTNILYVPSGTVVYTKETNSFIATTVGQALDISTLVASTSLIKVYISKETKLLSAKLGATALTVDERSDLILFCVLRITGAVFEITSTFNYKVDFSRNGIDISSDRVTFIPTSGTNAFINYDSATSKLTIPNDTLIRYGQLVVALPETEIDFKNTTTAQNLYYDLYTRTFVVKLGAYTLTVKERFRFVFVMGIRDNSINNTNRDTQAVKIDATFPYTVDGIRYGIQIPSTTVVENKLDDSVKAVAHRGYNGGATAAPENTLPAYSLAKQMGFSYVECDICFTSDNVAVVLHDDSIDRTSDGTGKIYDLTLEQVRTYDFGSWKNAKYTGTKIPTLKEFLQLCHNLNLHPYLEMKGGLPNGTQANIESIVDTVKETNMQGRVSYIGGIGELRWVHAKDPTARLGYVTNEPTQTFIDLLLSVKAQNEVFINANASFMTQAHASNIIAQGIQPEVWTVNTASMVKPLADMGLSGISTDLLNIRQILNDAY